VEETVRMPRRAARVGVGAAGSNTEKRIYSESSSLESSLQSGACVCPDFSDGLPGVVPGLGVNRGTFSASSPQLLA